MMRTLGSPKVGRILIAIICVAIILIGVGNLLNGRLEYRNYKGLHVFAPFAILVGSLGLIAALRPKSASAEAKKGRRIRGWPTGRTHDHRKPRKRLKPKVRAQ
jgi:hypothetical protein